MASVSFPHAALIVHLGKSLRNGSQGIDLRKGLSNRESGEMLGPLAPALDHSASTEAGTRAQDGHRPCWPCFAAFWSVSSLCSLLSSAVSLMHCSLTCSTLGGALEVVGVSITGSHEIKSKQNVFYSV